MTKATPKGAISKTTMKPQPCQCATGPDTMQAAEQLRFNAHTRETEAKTRLTNAQAAALEWANAAIMKTDIDAAFHGGVIYKTPEELAGAKPQVAPGAKDIAEDKVLATTALVFVCGVRSDVESAILFSNLIEADGIVKRLQAVRTELGSIMEELHRLYHV